MGLKDSKHTEGHMQSYTHFTVEEREKLWALKQQNVGINAIGRVLGRSGSSISRELSRNQNKDGSYNAWRGTTLYLMRRKRCVRKYRLLTQETLRDWVTKGLKKFWSPEIIVTRWKRAHPGERLSHTTIYRTLKKGLLPGVSVKTHLRRRGKRRIHRDSRAQTIHPDRLISQWSEEIRNREELGHWEGDTVYGGVGKGLLVTLIDRRSRYLAASLLKNREKGNTKDAVVKALEGQRVASLSLDNGSEFAAFHQMEEELGTEVYFAAPHAPWERGSNENVNGLLRFFFPKGFDFLSLPQDDLDSVLSLINNRPRKCLGWLSPIEFLNACCT